MRMARHHHFHQSATITIKSIIVISLLVISTVRCQSVDRSIVALQNDFAIKLFRELSCCDINVTCNVVLSPISFHTAVGMFLLGASGTNAAREILNLYRYKALYSENNIAEETRLITAAMRNSARQFSPIIDISIANSIYISDLFANQMQPAFRSDLLSYFNASTQMFDINSYETIHNINSWLDKQRRGMITKMFEERLPNNIKMLMVNNMFVQADWHYRFDPSKTRRDVFYNRGQETVLVYYLQERKFLRFGRSRLLNAALVELPFYGKTISMIIVLPNEKKGLARLVQQVLDADKLEKAFNTLLLIDIKVLLPRFRIEDTVSLTEHLRSLGLPDDFGDALDSKRLSDNTYDNILHKGFLEVYEKGARAEVSDNYEYDMEPNDAYISEPQEVYNANHPFLYIIRDNHSGAIITMGTVSEFSYNGDSFLLSRSIMNPDNRNCYDINLSIGDRDKLIPAFNLFVWLAVNLVLFYC